MMNHAKVTIEAIFVPDPLDEPILSAQNWLLAFVAYPFSLTHLDLPHNF